jgi:HEAT repeat protein
MIKTQQLTQLVRANSFCAACGVLIAAFSGCAGGQWSESAQALGIGTNAKNAKMRTRADQIKELRELANVVSNASSDEQQRISHELARMIRGESDPLVRAQQMRTIAACNTQVASIVVAAGLRDPDARVRVAACEGLVRRGGSDKIGLLKESLSTDPDPEVRSAAARVLSTLEDPGAGMAIAARGH